MSNPTRLVNGVSTQAIGQNLANYPNPDPFKVYTDKQDFDQYVAGDWTVTNTSSHGTVALTAGAGGLLSLAGGASSVTSDIVAIQSNPLDFNFATTNQVWFEARISATTAVNDQLQFGLVASNAALTPTDGIYFNKAAASASIDFVVRKSSTSTTQAAVATLVDATYIDLGFYYNASSNNGAIDVFVNGVKGIFTNSFDQSSICRCFSYWGWCKGCRYCSNYRKYNYRLYPVCSRYSSLIGGYNG